MRPNRPILAAVSAALAVLSARPAFASTPAILIDGQSVLTDVPPLASDGRVLVPLRGVFEKLGASVAYDAATQLITARLGYRIVMLTVGSRRASVNGRAVALEVPAREFAGRVEVPLRFVAEALGVNVDYDDASNTIAILSGKTFHPGGFVAAVTGPSQRYATAYGPSGKTAPRVESMRPDPDSIVGSPYPQVYARFAGGSSPVNPATVRVIFDGQEVTDSATVSSAYVSFTPAQALETGSHTVEVSGQADDGTPFSASWSFRVDAGNVRTDYSAVSAGGFGNPDGFVGTGGFVNPIFCCSRFGFFPPGFSVFVPGTIVFFAGNVIEIIFFNRFFPFGNGFFSIDGIAGTFPLVPWSGFPGFFWGTATVPFGARANNALVSAHFKASNGHTFIVHSTAPLTIDGTRTKAPSTLRYAVMPVLVDRPSSPRRLVIYRRLQQPTVVERQPIIISRQPILFNRQPLSGTRINAHSGGQSPSTTTTIVPVHLGPLERSTTPVIHINPQMQTSVMPRSGSPSYQLVPLKNPEPIQRKPSNGVSHQ